MHAHYHHLRRSRAIVAVASEDAKVSLEGGTTCLADLGEESLLALNNRFHETEVRPQDQHAETSR